MLMMAALSKAMLTDGRTLDQVVAPEVYAEVKRRAEKIRPADDGLQRMKPWLVAITLMAPTLQAAGFKPELGVDRHFFDRAKDSGMKRQALETMAYQLDRFDQLSPKLQEELLKTTMEDLDTRGERREGDGAGVDVRQRRGDGEDDARRAEGSAGAVSAAARRAEHNWIPHVETCLKENAGCFIVVGAAHLVGPGRLAGAAGQEGLQGHPAIASARRADTCGSRVRTVRDDQSPPKSGLNPRDSWHPA